MVTAPGPRAQGLSFEVWWSPIHPFKSGLTGQSSRELADAYRKATGKQVSMTLGFRHALFETAIDALKRAQKLDDPESIRDAIAKMRSLAQEVAVVDAELARRV
jgi:branched-chain amino acid transport system substrate-binding protein